MALNKLLVLIIFGCMLQAMQQSSQIKNFHQKDEEKGYSRHFKRELFLNDKRVSAIEYDIKTISDNASKIGFIRSLFVNPDYLEKELEKLTVIYAIQSMVRKVDNPQFALSIYVDLIESSPKLPRTFFENLGFEQGYRLQAFGPEMRRLEEIQKEIESKFNQET